MLFGKASLSKYIKEEDILMIYLQAMNDRTTGMEEKISNYTSKTDLLMEKINARADRENSERVASACKVLQEKFDRFEKEKNSQNDVIEEYIQKLEVIRSSKNLLDQSRRYLRYTRPQKLENNSFEA